MILFNLFKKKSPTLMPGESRGKLIGCYLLGIRGDHGEQDSYHSLATKKEGLIHDCRELFQSLHAMKVEQIGQPRSVLGIPEEFAGLMATQMMERHQQDLEKIKDFALNLERHIEQHLRGGCDSSFFSIPGIDLFLRMGVRERQKLKGRYIE